jgi:hypothetical protein
MSVAAVDEVLARRFRIERPPTTPFDSLRFYVPQAALDGMADEAGIPRVRGLLARQFGGRDLVLYGFA